MKRTLGELAHVRISRCEEGLAVAVIAWSESEYAQLEREMTGDRLKNSLGPHAPWPVIRRELPRLGTLLFVFSCEREDPAVSLRIDAGRQALAGELLRLEIESEVRPQ